MKIFSEFLNESKKIRLYHGDNYGTKKIEIKRMMTEQSNVQEGIGIYFSPKLKTAQSYGKYIIYCDVDPIKFFDSRKNISKYMNKNQFLKMMNYFEKIDKESLFYLMSNYSNISEPSELNKYAYLKAWDLMKNEEVRNFQIEFAESLEIESFVKIWNKIFPTNLGTHGKVDNFYAIINPNVKIYQYEGE